MDSIQLIGYILAVLVGVTLGLIGSGGSIVSVPIFVYILGVEPVLATAYSLFVVGVTAFIGGVQKAKQQLVDYNKVMLFGIPTLIAVFCTRKFLVPAIPDVVWQYNDWLLRKPTVIMVFFAIVMIVAALKMIRSQMPDVGGFESKYNYLKIILQGIGIGLIAGLVGAGGGFLIVPSLMFLTRMPMKKAVGTSLFIVAIQSLVGFLGDVQNNIDVNWDMLLGFVFAAIIGVFIGNNLAKKINGNELKKGFGWFVFVIGIYIIFKELL